MKQIANEEIIGDQNRFIDAQQIEFCPYKLKSLQKLYRVLKAFFDFVIALVALIILSPLFLLTAIAIKIDSKGPVFFIQKRIGKGGKEFNCIKFRSMAEDAKHDVAGYDYAEVSSYITKVGRIIRKLSIDELPQLFCLLTFKMSLIGYRPSQSCEYELNNARESYDMYQIRPGISGWAQVNGRDILAAQPKKKAAFDAYYLEHFSFWLDVKIFFMTIVKVFKSENIEEGVIMQETDDSKTPCLLIDKKDSTIGVNNSVIDNKEAIEEVKDIIIEDEEKVG